MSEYTYEQLKALTVADLREIAKGIENDELEGFSTKHKEQLLPILCKVLHISTHHIAAGEEKVRLKAMIHKFQGARGDKSKAAVARHQIHVMKHKLRKMAETTAK